MEQLAKTKKRILQYLEYKDITKRQFCEITKISYPNLLGKSLESEFGGAQINEILSNFSEISPDWLILGKGEMLRQAENKKIPLITTKAFAGPNGWDQAGETFAGCPHYTIPDMFGEKADFIIQIYGDSMKPRYESGDMVICRYVLDHQFIQWGKIYVIDSEQGAMIKRLCIDPNGEDTLLLKSENPDYAPIRIAKNEIRHLALVIGLFRIEE
ncbi:MAG: helix-turn-helix transcriptional regulator [Paludibacteraceae bacterium]|nr:helix-turn-helix transcriptional regulator [Paludibacteraceae bacterium]